MAIQELFDQNASIVQPKPPGFAVRSSLKVWLLSCTPCSALFDLSAGLVNSLLFLCKTTHIFTFVAPAGKSWRGPHAKPLHARIAWRPPAAEPAAAGRSRLGEHRQPLERRAIAPWRRRPRQRVGLRRGSGAALHLRVCQLPGKLESLATAGTHSIWPIFEEHSRSERSYISQWRPPTVGFLRMLSASGDLCSRQRTNCWP